MTALVTGSTGFCGRRLCAALSDERIPVVRVSERASEPGIERVDLADGTAVAAMLARVRPDVVFHLHGAMTADRASTFVRVNTLAAATLLDALGQTELEETVVMFAGSAAEYGSVGADLLPVTEDAPVAPVTAYGVTKYAQTKLALEAAQKGIRTIVVRPSNIVGAGMPEHFAFASFARQLAEIERGLRPAVLQVGNLGSVRDFVDVDDVVSAYISLSRRSEAIGQVFNVSSGRGIQLREGLERLISTFGVAVDVRTDASRLRAADVSTFYASRAKLDHLLGPSPLVPFEQSIRAIVEHARNEVKRSHP